MGYRWLHPLQMRPPPVICPSMHLYYSAFAATRNQKVQTMSNTTSLAYLVLAMMVTVTSACSPSPESVTPGSSNQVTDQFDDSLQTLAEVFAESLGNETLRTSLLEAFKRSPRLEHRLDFAGYLNEHPMMAGELERRLSEYGLDLDDLMDRMSGFQLWIPVAIHRMSWEGSDDVIVLASTQSLSELGRDSATVVMTPSIPGFRIGGDSVAVPLFRWMPETIIVLMPPSGSDDTSLRHQVGWNEDSGSAVSNPQQELELRQIRGIREENWVPEEASGSTDRLLSGLLVDYSWQECTVLNSVDKDRDGLVDACEYEVANTFRPRLYFHSEEDDHSRQRQTYWAVRAASNQSLLILYALAYYRDTGLFGHDGDSEYIMLTVKAGVEVQGQGAWWQTQLVDVSAHAGSLFDKSAAVTDPNWVDDRARGRPIIWVAKGKHANYVTQSGCGFFEKCGSEQPDEEDQEDVDVLEEANLGGGRSRRSRPLVNCVWNRDHPANPGLECFWEKGFDFRGWQSASDGVTPYWEYLHKYGEFVVNEASPFPCRRNSKGGKGCTSPISQVR